MCMPSNFLTDCSNLGRKSCMFYDILIALMTKLPNII